MSENENDSDVVAVTKGDLDLAKNPRKISVTSSTDGYTYEAKDDGVAVTDDGVEPGQLRQTLFKQLQRPRRPDGKPAFFLTKPVAPLYKGDPLSSFMTADNPVAQAVIASGKAHRESVHASAQDYVTTTIAQAKENHAAMMEKKGGKPGKAA